MPVRPRCGLGRGRDWDTTAVTAARAVGLKALRTGGAARAASAAGWRRALTAEFGLPVRIVADADELSDPAEAAAVRAAALARTF